jgi:BNR repeat protein
VRVVAAGTFWNAACAPVNQRTASATSALMLSDGTIIATCRLGTDREGPDGHTGVFASRDLGETWELRSISLAERVWDDWPGETRGWYIAELRPGELTATVLWTDRSNPDRPWVNPSTQGLLGMRVYHLVSRDGGRSWTHRRRIDLAPHVGASSTGPVLGLADGTLGQPFETWKAWDDPAPGRPGAFLRLSTDGGATWVDDVLVARDPDNRIFFWDQRLETHPQDGRLVNMFWTHDVQEGRDIDVHISWASPDGRAWTYPVSTGIAGQHTQPIWLGGDRLLAVYSQRQNPPGIRAILSADFGRSWDRSTDIEVYASDAGDEPGSGASRAQEDYWNDMGAWQFGHPRGARLPNSEVLVVFYGGRGLVRSARWARLAV